MAPPSWRWRDAVHPVTSLRPALICTRPVGIPALASEGYSAHGGTIPVAQSTRPAQVRCCASAASTRCTQVALTVSVCCVHSLDALVVAPSLVSSPCSPCSTPQQPHYHALRGVGCHACRKMAALAPNGAAHLSTLQWRLTQGPCLCSQRPATQPAARSL